MTRKHKLNVFLLLVLMLAAATFFQAAPGTPEEKQLRTAQARLAMAEWRLRRSQLLFPFLLMNVIK